MKRCPMCEFLYEDDQRLCDMDGASLVIDTRNLPNLNALGPQALVLVARRYPGVPFIVALVLAMVLALVYYALA